MKIFKQIIAFLLVAIALWGAQSCSQPTTPKPRGYFRIDFPAHQYQLCDSALPYKFEYPVYAKIVSSNEKNSEPYWINVKFPAFDAILHLSYKNVKGNLYVIEEDSRQLAYKHSIKADAINERMFVNASKNMYGVFYEIKGDAASAVQFYLTDSISHFVRGSLYFNSIPNKDSLAPVVDFVKLDIMHLMESFEWKNL